MKLTLLALVLVFGPFTSLSFPQDPAREPTQDEFRERLDSFLKNHSGKRAHIPEDIWDQVGRHSREALLELEKWIARMERGEAEAVSRAEPVGRLLSCVYIHNQRAGQPATPPMYASEMLMWRMAKLGGESALAALPHLEPPLEPEPFREVLLALGRDPNRDVRVWAGRVFAASNPRTGQFGRAIPMLVETLEALLEQERLGATELVATPYFGAGPENRTEAARKLIAEQSASMSTPGKLPLIRLFMEKEPVGAIRAAALRGLFNVYAGEPYIPAAESVPLLRKALQDPSAAVAISAMDGIREIKQAELTDDLISLASHHRRIVREAAARALAPLGKKAPPYDAGKSGWPQGVRKAFVEFAGRGLADPRGAQRGRATLMKRTSWGDRRNGEDLLGWKMPNAGFIDDAQETGLPVGGAEGFRATDFDQELESRIDAPDSKRPQARPATEVGERLEDLFRMVWALSLGKDHEALALFRRVSQDYDSDSDLIDSLAAGLGWLLHLHALDAFAQGDDGDALAYVGRIELLSQYAKPQRALGHYVGTARRLRQEVELRSSQKIAAVPPEAPEDLPAYWVSRLAEIRGRQMGQPGGVGIFTDAEPKVAERLVRIGVPALPLLVEHFWDERWIRAVEFWRDFAGERHAVTCGRAARSIFSAIVKDHKVALPERFRSIQDDLSEVEKRAFAADFKKWFDRDRGALPK